MPPDVKPPTPNRGVPGSLGVIEAFGVSVRFHFTFVLFMVYLAVLGAEGEHSTFGMAGYGLGLFMSLLMHELGHAWIAHRFGHTTEEILMLPMGGVARMQRQPAPHEDFWISLAGPLVSIAAGGVLWVAASWGGSLKELPELLKPSDANLLHRLAVGNLLLAFFNLLPAFPMDGGRIFRALFLHRRREPEATRAVARIGTAMAAVLGLYGLITGGFLLVFLAFFIYVGGLQETLVSTGKSLMRGEPVSVAMVTDFRTLSHGDTIREAAQLLLATSQQDFPVLVGDRVEGLLSRTALLRALAEQGPEGYVAGAMNRDFASISPDADLAEAAPLIARSGECMLVMQGDLLIGLLTAENLSEYLVLRRLGGPAHEGGNGTNQTT